MLQKTRYKCDTHLWPPRPQGKKFQSFSYAFTASDVSCKMKSAFSVYKEKIKQRAVLKVLQIRGGDKVTYLENNIRVRYAANVAVDW